MKVKKTIKFYGDNEKLKIKNKLHTYRVNNLKDAIKAIIRFERIGYKIRSAWYVENRNSKRIK